MYGDSGLENDEKPKTEDQPLKPGNPYAATKVSASLKFWYFFCRLPLSTMLFCTSKLTNCQSLFCESTTSTVQDNGTLRFGISSKSNFVVQLVPRFIEVAKTKEKFTVQGSGKQLRSWLYVDDAARGVCLATERGRVGEVYNLGTYYEKNGLL